MKSQPIDTFSICQGWTGSHFFGPPRSSGESSPGRSAHAPAATARVLEDVAAEAGDFVIGNHMAMDYISMDYISMDDLWIIYVWMIYA